MCCILCEEPVRSATLSLAAVGIVSLVNSARRIWTARTARQTELQRTSLEDCGAAIPVDAAP